MSASDLFALCTEWKDLCLEAVASTIGGTIEHAFVSAGPPAIDCVPQLAVYPGGVAEGDTQPLSPPLSTGRRDSLAGSVHLVEMTCLVVRCAPTVKDGGEFPSVDELEASAAETSEDIWAIWNYTRSRHRANLLFASASGAREVILDPAFPVPPGGDAQGWQIPIRVQLGGYPAPPPAP